MLDNLDIHNAHMSVVLSCTHDNLGNHNACRSSQVVLSYIPDTRYTRSACMTLSLEVGYCKGRSPYMVVDMEDACILPWGRCTHRDDRRRDRVECELALCLT